MSFSRCCLPFFLFVHACIGLDASTIYVDQNAGGANNGSSWTDAYTDLQLALANANSGDEIWVADGTYYPTTGTDRDIAFEIPAGVELYGGFSGFEENRESRNPFPSAAGVVLSGEIGLDFSRGDNSRNVVRVVGADAVLDGFMVTRGAALASGSTSVPLSERSGAGIFVEGDSSFKFTGRNLLLTQNTADQGAALFLDMTATELYDVRIEDNDALLMGGGILGGDGAWFERISVEGNSTSGGDGGISINGGAVTMVNCLIAGNRTLVGNAGGLGGTDASLTVINCTITGNRCVNSGGGIGLTNGELTIYNTVIAQNLADVGPAQDYEVSTVNVLVESNNFIGGDPLFSVPIDPNTAPNSSGIYTLETLSPLINAGDNAFIPAGVTTDRVGDDRIKSGTVDIGAYERTLPNFAGLFPGLDPLDDDNGNGLSNFIDYAHGYDPEEPAPFPVMLVRDDGTGPVFTFSRREGIDDVRFVIEWTDKLNSPWSELDEGDGYTIESLTNVDLVNARFEYDIAVGMDLSPETEYFIRARYQDLDAID